MMSRRLSLLAAMAAVTLATPAFGAPATPCPQLVDDRGDEVPPPLAASYPTPGDLDIHSLAASTEGSLLRFVLRTRTLTLPVPVGHRLHYVVYLNPDGGDSPHRYKIDLDFDQDYAVYRLFRQEAEADPRGGGDVNLGIAPLRGRADPRTAILTVDVPLSLVPELRAGTNLQQLAVGAFHGVGNPTVVAAGEPRLGSSGYNKIADGAYTDVPYRVGTSCRR